MGTKTDGKRHEENAGSGAVVGLAGIPSLPTEATGPDHQPKPPATYYPTG